MNNANLVRIQCEVVYLFVSCAMNIVKMFLADDRRYPIEILIRTDAESEYATFIFRERSL